MIKNNIKAISAVIALAVTIVITSNAGVFFDAEKPAVSKEEVQNSAEFKKALEKIDRQKVKMLNELDISKVAPEVENLNQKAPKVDLSSLEGIDVQAIAKRYEQAEKQQQAGERVYIFVTLDMPKATIKKLAEDVQKVDGALVLRGFYEGSLKNTYAKIGELELKSGNIQINPDAFKKYKIDKAPSFVVVKKLGIHESLDLDGCAIPEDYIKISGDVTLRYALEKMEGLVAANEKNIVNKQLSRLL